MKFNDYDVQFLGYNEFQIIIQKKNTILNNFLLWIFIKTEMATLDWDGRNKHIFVLLFYKKQYRGRNSNSPLF